MTTKLTTYDALLLEHKPRPIRSDRDHRRALRQIDQLMRGGPHLSRSESEMVELLATLIENYEATSFPTPVVPPVERLVHLIETRGITQADLARATSIPKSTLANVLSGRRGLSQANIARLAAYFQVPAGEFIAPPDN